jgi:hypothetical protein
MSSTPGGLSMRTRPRRSGRCAEKVESVVDDVRPSIACEKPKPLKSMIQTNCAALMPQCDVPASSGKCPSDVPQHFSRTDAMWRTVTSVVLIFARAGLE